MISLSFFWFYPPLWASDINIPFVYSINGVCLTILFQHILNKDLCLLECAHSECLFRTTHNKDTVFLFLPWLQFVFFFLFSFFSRNFGSVVLRCSGRKELGSIKAICIYANIEFSVTGESSAVLQDFCCCCSFPDVCGLFDNHERHKPRLLLY